MTVTAEQLKDFDGLEVIPLQDDGLVPNSALPVLVYRRILRTGTAARAVQDLFAGHGWGRSWVNGIFSHHHYHSTAHEVLGITRGSARVQLGGPEGPVAEIAAGDVVVLPAGAGHKKLGGGGGLEVVGAYPDDGLAPDLCEATAAARPGALENLGAVPLPGQDPVFGGAGLLRHEWPG